MALSGVHVTCGYTGGREGNIRLFGPLLWSQTMSVAGTTTQVAPGLGIPIFEVYSSADVYVAIGANPDATNGTRVFVPAATMCDFIARNGDKLAWVLA